ncbi:WD40 repeat-like protein [Obba rivulosa]|uniref:WD40 repeat-like protein n=1 Tax=Obba rivulosa TaxID=1052685 RepID=A0A8E2DPK5_9APHY|nr:WD40 repeat-like protein [Obba rivulosa]
MAHSDTDDDVDDNDFDGSSDAEGEDDIEEDLLDALEGDLAAAAAAEAAEEASDADEDTDTDDSDVGSDDEYDVPLQKTVNEVREHIPAPVPPSRGPSPPRESPQNIPHAPSPTPEQRPPTPAQIRRAQLVSEIRWPRSYTVEAICALPHPVPTHALASSLCMTHLLTGSDDGYIRDYDIFTAVNGKNFLTAPQRHHCAVMEGIMKAGQIRYWWENPNMMQPATPGEDMQLSPVYSLAMHSDALWALAGSDHGQINLFTVRHEPGRLIHSMFRHRGPVSGLALQHDEKGFFSAGWDGEAVQWDLNTGQPVRSFMSHGAQLAAIGVRPLASNFHGHPWEPPPIPAQRPAEGSASQGEVYVQATLAGTNSSGTLVDGAQSFTQNTGPAQSQQDDDVKSEASYDPLFDEEPDADGEADDEVSQPSQPSALRGSYPGSAANGSFPNAASQRNGQVSQAQQRSRIVSSGVPAPKNAPAVLDPVTYASFSPDTLMTAFIDGQIILWDTRVNSPGRGVGRLWMSEKTPPWCLSACWSADGTQIYAGRRNGAVDIYDVRQTGRAASGTPKVLKTLRNPISSGVVSCVVSFPDGRHLASASQDNIRLWNVAEAVETDVWGKTKGGVQFKIIPGHHGGFISQMLVDAAARFLVSASSNRGWHGESTRTVFVHEIKHIH